MINKHNFKRAFLSILMLTSTMFTSVVPPALQTINAESTLATYDAQGTNCITDSDNGNSNSSSDNSSGDDQSDGIPNKTNVKPIYEYMNGKYGLSSAAIAGILGNWIDESHIDPTSTYPSQFGVEIARKQDTTTATGTAVGLGQWVGGRRLLLMNFAKSNNKDWWDRDVQLEFMFTADGGDVATLKTYAQTATNDVVANALLWEKLWERADGAGLSVRTEGAKNIYSYLQKNNMNGGSDKTKIDTINGSSSGTAASPTNNAGVTISGCDSNNTSGSMGASVQPNGKSGNVVQGGYELSQVPEDWKKVMTLPEFKAPDWSASPFQGKLAGQCTEFTWAYMSQLWDGEAEKIGDGGEVWKSYQSDGAKITDSPTVGYGVSGWSGGLGSISSAGHTGVVVGVFGDGSFILEQFNAPPDVAPSRIPVFTKIDGSNGQKIKFFSGIGKPKVDMKTN